MTRRRTWMLLFLFGGLALLAVSAAAAGGFLDRPAQPPAPSAPEDGPAVVCFGHVDGEHGVTPLTPAQPGRVVEVPAREGDEVAAGAVLLRLDDGPARLRVAEAEAALAVAEVRLNQAGKLPGQHRARVAQQRAALDAARHRLAAARAALARKRELHQIDHLSGPDVKVAEEQVSELEAAARAEEGRAAELGLTDPAAEVLRAEAEVSAAKARLGQARHALGECVLTAPTDGTVLRVAAAVGELLTGAPRTPAVQFLPRGARVIRAEVDQEFAGRLTVGQVALARDDASPGAAWRGRVLRLSGWYAQRRSVSLEPFQRSDVRTLECLIEVEPGQPPLRIGQRMQVTLGRDSR